MTKTTIKTSEVKTIKGIFDHFSKPTYDTVGFKNVMYCKVFHFTGKHITVEEPITGWKESQKEIKKYSYVGNPKELKPFVGHMVEYSFKFSEKLNAWVCFRIELVEDELNAAVEK